MSVVVEPDGPTNTHLVLCGERPGDSEVKAGVGFVGPAGEELWDTFANEQVPQRHHWWVTNLVKTFSKEPPTVDEVAHWKPALRKELRTVQPLLIVTVGAHAARYFLGPDFDIRRQHGLLFETHRSYTPSGAKSYVFPLYHSSAALQQPEMYQRVFRQDIAQLGRFFKEGLKLHEPIRPDFPVHDLRPWTRRTDRLIRELVSLSSGALVGCDTEGTLERPEAATFYVRGQGFLVGTDRRSLTVARLVLSGCRAVVFHYAVHDLRVLWGMGLDVGECHDSMLQAYLLNEHAVGLKTLCYRHFQWEMADFQELIQPLDDAYVRASLERYRGEVGARLERAAARLSPAQDGDSQPRTARKRVRGTRPKHLRLALSDEDKRAKRSLTSVAKILTKDTDQTIRKRWKASAFYDLNPLDPEPTWQNLDEEVGVSYAVTDAKGAHDLHRLFRPALRRDGLCQCYEMDRAVLPMLARIEHVGLLVDRARLSTLRTRVVEEYAEVCQQIEDFVGYPLNPKAHEDVSDTLFGELNVTPTIPLKKPGVYTTRDKYLEARKKEHAVIPLIIRGRELDKMRGSYCDRLPKLLSEAGVYHPEWSYTRTATGRLAERIIILIPKHSDIGKLIRQCFIARPRCRILSNDLAQIELRVLAHLSRDRALIDIFEQGRDPHTETAHDLLGAPKRKEDQDESKHRLPSKKCNFGAFMGLSSRGLTEQIRAGGNPDWARGCGGCDDPRADHSRDCDSVRFFAEYFKKFSGIKAYIDDRHAEARRTGYVRDLFGRRIVCSGVYSTGRSVVRRAERIAQATPVQATADGISKVWMTRIWTDIIQRRRKDRLYCEPWNRVHDDTLLEVDRQIARDVQRDVLACVPQLLCVPTAADGKVGRDWGSLK